MCECYVLLCQIIEPDDDWTDIIAIGDRAHIQAKCAEIKKKLIEAEALRPALEAWEDAYFRIENEFDAFDTACKNTGYVSDGVSAPPEFWVEYNRLCEIKNNRERTELPPEPKPPEGIHWSDSLENYHIYTERNGEVVCVDSEFGIE